MALRCIECIFSNKTLIGDSFYLYKCVKCSHDSTETFERLPISWSNLIQLVLYHLWMKGERRHRYFRWKEDICGTIEDRWEDLIPLKIKGPSWHNSVSSALSSNDRIFSSGMAIKGVPGWWSLHQWDPPTPRKQAINNSSLTALKFKRTYQEVKKTKTEDVLTLSSESESDLLNVTESQSENEESKIMSNNYQYGDLIVDDEEGEEINNETLILTHTHHKRTEPVPTVAPSADLKKQLLERLLLMDSSLLDEAIKKAKARKQLVQNSNVTSESAESGKRKRKKEKGNGSETDNYNNTNNETIIKTSSTLNSSSQSQLQSSLTFKIPQDCQDTLSPLLQILTRILTAFPVIRASPYENDLLKKCNRVNYFEIKVAARLRRKLLLRRQRRRVNFALFDIDNFMYHYLKSAETPLKYYSTDDTTKAVELELVNVNENETENPNPSSHNQSKMKMNFDFDPETIPYISDPSRSLYVKLTGMAALYGTCPFPIVSPFSGKLLPEFVDEDEECQVPKLLVLNQLRSLRFRRSVTNNDNDNDNEIDDFVNVDVSNNLRPSSLNLHLSTSIVLQEHPSLTLKYTNIRKEFVGQLNDILSQSFWPGIDVSEALDCPDYAILALVGLSVVGCAIINTEGYLSYLHVRPDFQGHGIATRLLSLLLPQLSPRKDLTLHVSVSNAPAMVLYQKIGFKPEEFIVNFYDKYLGGSDGDDSLIGNKNAFLMRLRR